MCEGEVMGTLGTEDLAMGTYLQILLVVGVGGPADNIGCIQARSGAETVQHHWRLTAFIQQKITFRARPGSGLNCNLNAQTGCCDPPPGRDRYGEETWLKLGRGNARGLACWAPELSWLGTGLGQRGQVTERWEMRSPRQ